MLSPRLSHSASGRQWAKAIMIRFEFNDWHSGTRQRQTKKRRWIKVPWLDATGSARHDPLPGPLALYHRVKALGSSPIRGMLVLPPARWHGTHCCRRSEASRWPTGGEDPEADAGQHEYPGLLSPLCHGHPSPLHASIHPRMRTSLPHPRQSAGEMSVRLNADFSDHWQGMHLARSICLVRR